MPDNSIHGPKQEKEDEEVINVCCVCCEEMRELAGGKGRFVFVELDAFSLRQCAALAERINAEVRVCGRG